MIKWHLEIFPINSLKEHAKNPRQITKEHSHRLQNLIEKFGLIDRPIVNKDFTIIGGHQRIKILKKMKQKTVECWTSEVQLLKEDIDELCIGLNLNQGNWDWDILANNFEPLNLLKYGFTEHQLLGYFEEKENIQSEQEEKSKEKKNKECPNCGHSF